MGLEVVVNINDFVTTNPTGSDPKSAGDDHLRYIKTALKNDFAGFTGAVIVTGVDGGAADAYTLTPTHAVVAYTTKMLVEFTPAATNTTTTPTLNISALGAKTIKSVANAALVAGDLVISVPTLLVYDGTNLRLLGPTKNYVDQLAFSAALPAQSLGFLSSNGSVASFTKNLTFGLNEAKAADVASAATPDIWAGNGNTLHITGTTTLTGFAAAPQAGAWRKLYFDGACLLTNGANFNVQGGANYTTAAGDMVWVYADTTTKFYLFIEKADGRAVVTTTYALTLLATLTPTAAANVDFLTTFSATYDNYLILGSGIRPSADDTLRYRLAVAGAADAGANYYSGAGAGFSSSATSAIVHDPTVTTAGLGLSFAIKLLNANDTTNLKIGLCQSTFQSGAAPAYSQSDQGNAYKATNAVTGIRFLWAAGSNFAATGKIRVYGYQNS